MKHRTADLEGALLDAAVAKAEGKWSEEAVRAVAEHPGVWRPSLNWQFGGPIIERERIELSPHGGAENPWQAECTGWPHQDSDGIWRGIGPTPLIAAMRAFVASKFGDEVELP